MIKVLLDTNFLLIPAQFNVDVFAEIDRIMDEPYELVMLDRALEELETLKEKEPKLKDRQAAKLGLAILKKQDVQILNTDSKLDVDSLTVETADKGWMVATQDVELKQRLKDKGLSSIGLRQKQYLEIYR